jgi:DNA-binding response OmpR family regulator
MKTIIHIDNSSFFRKVMGGFLTREGFEVEGFDNADDADMAISGGTAAMVIAGLAFAGMEGEDFIRRTRESYSGPMVIVSSSIDPEREARLRELGVNAAISKSGPWQEALRPLLEKIR